MATSNGAAAPVAALPAADGTTVAAGPSVSAHSLDALARAVVRVGGARAVEVEVEEGEVIDEVEEAPADEADAHGAVANGEEEDDDYLCVICQHACAASEPIWTCRECHLTVHLACMRAWVREGEATQKRFSRCPGCQHPLQHTSHELAYTCYCGRVDWANELAAAQESDDPEHEPREPAHSCGGVCQRPRAHGCPHACTAVCHRGRCAPCAETRSGVRCRGGHQIFADFACGSPDEPVCTHACGAQLECGHACTAKCHGPETPHAACAVPVAKVCCCPAAQRVTVPCAQQTVQCDTVCTRLLACGYHRCGRRCHPGACAEKLVVSAWGAKSWVRIGGSGNGAAMAPSATAASSQDFPSLGATGISASPLTASAAATSSKSSAFQTCGKPCGRMRVCGHPCAQVCHELTVPPTATADANGVTSASSASLTAAPSNLQPPALLGSTAAPAAASPSAQPSPSPACESARCTTLVALACPCGRKTGKLRCFEVASAQAAGKFACDETCAAYANGRRFFRALDAWQDRTAEEEDKTAAMAATRTNEGQPTVDGTVAPSPHHRTLLLPFTASMLQTVAATSTVQASSTAGMEGSFLNKLEAQIQKFVLMLAAASDPSATSASKSAKSTVGQSGNMSSTHLYLSNLTPHRRVLVTQLALWHNLHFDQDGGYLVRPSRRTHGVDGTGTSVANSAAHSRTLSRAVSEDSVAAMMAAASLGDAASSLTSLPSPTSLLLPSMSLATAAALFTDPSSAVSSTNTPAAAALNSYTTVLTAETWPVSLVLKLQFSTDHHFGDGGGAGSSGNIVAGSSSASSRTIGSDRLLLLRRWFAPFAPVASRLIIASPRVVLALFADASEAQRCHAHLTKHHASELESLGVGVGAPAVPSTDAAAVEVLDAVRLERAELARQTSEARRATEAEYAALQAKAAKARAENTPASESILHTTMKQRQARAVTKTRSTLVGHTKLRVQSTNAFDLLMEED